jgi:hypothetical protein
MGATTIPAVISSKTRYVATLTSGVSWTVPAGVTYVNVTLRGAGGGGNYSTEPIGTTFYPQGTAWGFGGQIVTSTLTTTPGASITYSIGAGGAGGTTNGTAAGDGGTTTFTGATSAVGGKGASGDAVGQVGTAYLSANNGGASGNIQIGWANLARNGGAGGAGSIDVEYWV